MKDIKKKKISIQKKKKIHRRKQKKFLTFVIIFFENLIIKLKICAVSTLTRIKSRLFTKLNIRRNLNLDIMGILKQMWRNIKICVPCIKRQKNKIDQETVEEENEYENEAPEMEFFKTETPQDNFVDVFDV